MSQSPDVEELSFLDILQQYRRAAGRVIGVSEVILAGLMGGAGAWISILMPTANFVALINSLAPIIVALAGTILGVSLAAFAITVSLISTPWLGKLRRAGGFPAIVIPYWSSAVAWVVVVILGLGMDILASYYAKGQDLFTNPIHLLAIGLVIADLTFVGLALSLTLSLFGSLIRLIDLKLATDDIPLVPRHPAIRPVAGKEDKE